VTLPLPASDQLRGEMKNWSEIEFHRIPVSLQAPYFFRDRNFKESDFAPVFNPDCHSPPECGLSS